MFLLSHFENFLKPRKLLYMYYKAKQNSTKSTENLIQFENLALGTKEIERK